MPDGHPGFICAVPDARLARRALADLKFNRGLVLGTAREAARTELVRDGFPTDRVELTSVSEPGAAGLIAAESSARRFRRYFGTLFDEERHRGCAEYLARRFEQAASPSSRSIVVQLIEGSGRTSERRTR